MKIHFKVVALASLILSVSAVVAAEHPVRSPASGAEPGSMLTGDYAHFKFTQDNIQSVTIRNREVVVTSNAEPKGNSEAGINYVTECHLSRDYLLKAGMSLGDFAVISRQKQVVFECSGETMFRGAMGSNALLVTQASNPLVISF